MARTRNNKKFNDDKIQIIHIGYCCTCKKYTGNKGCKPCIRKKKIAEIIGKLKPKLGFIYNFKYRCTRKVFSNGNLIDIRILKSIKNRIIKRCLKSIGRIQENYTERILKFFNPHLKGVLGEIFNN